MWDILFLLESGPLTPFEEEFIKSLKRFKTVSPKQDPIIKKIIAKYLKNKPG